MDSIIQFLENASSGQLLALASAIAVWVLGGYFLKKRLTQRLASQSLEPNTTVELEDIRFEDINRTEWKIFATLTIIFISLIALTFYLPDLF